MKESTDLYRQIHPSWITNGRIGSHAFVPSAKDSGMLSVYDGEQFAAIQAWTHYTTVLNHASAGVCSLTAAEAGSVKLSSRMDETGPGKFPGHAVIDFNSEAKSRWKTLGKQLRDFAVARGFQAMGTPASP